MQKSIRFNTKPNKCKVQQKSTPSSPLAFVHLYRSILVQEKMHSVMLKLKCQEGTL